MDRFSSQNVVRLFLQKTLFVQFHFSLRDGQAGKADSTGDFLPGQIPLFLFC